MAKLYKSSLQLDRLLLKQIVVLTKINVLVLSVPIRSHWWCLRWCKYAVAAIYNSCMSDVYSRFFFLTILDYKMFLFSSLMYIVLVGGTVPSWLWPRGRTVWPRKRPASSGLRMLLEMIKEIKCQLLQRKFAPFPNKSFGKNTVCLLSLV